MSHVETRPQLIAVASLSLLLALLLWLSVTLEHRAEVSLSVPVLLEGLPPGMALASSPPGRLELKISGPRLLLFKLDWVRPVCRLDLSATAAGTVTFGSPETLLHLDPELKVVRVYPTAITLTLVGEPKR